MFMTTCNLNAFIFIVLCVLGDPSVKERCVVIDGFSQLAVKAKENASTDSCQLALKLMDVFFTKELSAGNCTEAEGRELLRQDDIDGIRCKSFSLTKYIQ